MKQLQTEKATHNVFDPLHREVMQSQFGIQLPLIAEKKHSKVCIHQFNFDTIISFTCILNSCLLIYSGCFYYHTFRFYSIPSTLLYISPHPYFTTSLLTTAYLFHLPYTLFESILVGSTTNQGSHCRLFDDTS